MSYFIFTDLISSLLEPGLVNPGSTLIHVRAYTTLSGWKMLNSGEWELKSSKQKEQPIQLKISYICKRFGPQLMPLATI